jgi:crotonobetainyl-CoA:carnitine CoA-transferase CaiB-like acyl-CoA transferase
VKTPATTANSGGALAGLRVLDLTWVLAGPYATKLLGEHGAQIIKIESKHRQDPTRFAASMRLRPHAGPDDSAYFMNFNRNKRSVTLNLRTAQGCEVLRDLVPHCDVVVENFSPGVLARWGMDYESLRAMNPDVILVSMAGVGQSGPWSRAVTFADILAAMSGLSGETADASGTPLGVTFGLGDMVAGNAAALAVLDLVARGSGGYVDLSQLETMAATMGTVLVEQHVRAPRPNRSPRAVPHGVYPAAGADRWVAITAQDDQQWVVLQALAELPDVPDRWEQHEAVDAALSDWTRRRDAAHIAELLQAAGVAAAVVATGQDLVDRDEHLAAREFYSVLEHPIAGAVRHEGIVARLSRTPGALTSPSPLLGQHTVEVLRELLDVDDARIEALAAAGAIE